MTERNQENNRKQALFLLECIKVARFDIDLRLEHEYRTKMLQTRSQLIMLQNDYKDLKGTIEQTDADLKRFNVKDEGKK